MVLPNVLSRRSLDCCPVHGFSAPLSSTTRVSVSLATAILLLVHLSTSYSPHGHPVLQNVISPTTAHLILYLLIAAVRRDQCTRMFGGCA